MPRSKKSPLLLQSLDFIRVLSISLAICMIPRYSRTVRKQCSLWGSPVLLFQGPSLYSQCRKLEHHSVRSFPRYQTKYDQARNRTEMERRAQHDLRRAKGIQKYLERARLVQTCWQACSPIHRLPNTLVTSAFLVVRKHREEVCAEGVMPDLHTRQYQKFHYLPLVNASGKALQP
eukprot:XP_017174864.1 PREDICTED: uncharacterized protein LOC102635707 [Mus musculus]